MNECVDQKKNYGTIQINYLTFILFFNFIILVN